MIETKLIWITGLSASGKTSLANEVVKNLRSRNIHAILLDGDKLREIFDIETVNQINHSREARISLAMSYSRLCLNLILQGFTVVIATISLFREIHNWNRLNIPGYFEVYLKIPIQELYKRDPKGIYARFSRSEIKNVAGLDLEIDEPENPDCIFEFNPERSTSDIAAELDKLLR